MEQLGVESDVDPLPLQRMQPQHLETAVALLAFCLCQQHRRLAERHAARGFLRGFLELLRVIRLTRVALVLDFEHGATRLGNDLLLYRLVPFQHLHQHPPQSPGETAREPEPELAIVGGRQSQQEPVLGFVVANLDLVYAHQVPAFSIQRLA
ncbi:hypothetical protein D3C83_05960 [compost metagenome]